MRCAPFRGSFARRCISAAVLAAGLSAQVGGAGAQDKPVGVRMMLKVQIPVEAGNDAVKAGDQGKIFEQLMERINPEAAYFSQEDGLRTAYFVYLIRETTDFAAIHEPLIQGLGARVYDQPALTWDELKHAFENIDEKP